MGLSSELVEVNDVEANDLDFLHETLRLSLQRGGIFCLEIFLEEVRLIVEPDLVGPLTAFLVETLADLLKVVADRLLVGLPLQVALHDPNAPCMLAQGLLDLL